MSRRISKLVDSVELISTTLENNTASSSPYFIIAGAGVSLPEIKDSSTIVDECIGIVKSRFENNNAQFERIFQEGNILSDNKMKFYSYWFSVALPNRVDRSKYLKKLIRGARISAANLLLAQILISRKLATTVVTTNFDDKLRQALELMGETDIFVADNPYDNLALDINADQIQIAHVHGTYHFYDCANLESEICQISKQSGLVSASTSIYNFLLSKAPIVVGYSGWENDVIMNCIKERISYPIPYKFIWVCYCSKDYDNLPSWLKECEDICFVVPPECFTDDIKDTFLSKSMDDPNVIPAELFFNSIISRLNIDAPTILKNPYEYYSQMLNKVLPQNEDVLHLKRWAERMRYLGTNKSVTEKIIEELELFSSRKDYENIIICINKLTEDITLRIGDCLYVFESIIIPLFKTESAISSFEIRIKLHEAATNYILNHMHYFDTERLKVSLTYCVRIRLPKDQRNLQIPLLDKILYAIKDCQDLLSITVLALGIKSGSVPKEEALNVLNQLLLLSEDHDDDDYIASNRFIAYLRMIDLINDADLAIKIWLKAEKLCSRINDKQDKVNLLMAQSNAALVIDNLELKHEWLKHSIEELLLMDTKKYYNSILFTCKNIIKESYNYKYALLENLKNSIVKKVVDLNINIPFDDCEGILLWSIVINEYLVIMDDYKHRYIYGEKVLLTINSAPFKCDGILWQEINLLAKMMCCPNMIVPTETKIKYLLRMREIVSENNGWRNIYQISIEVALNYMLETDLIDGGFGEEIQIVKDGNRLDAAYENYVLGKFEDAEEGFLSLINSPNESARKNARINLAYMIRRGETKSQDQNISELLSVVENSFVFKQVNVFLCHLTGIGYTQDTNQALLALSSIDAEGITKALDWWNRTELVGEKECQIVQLFLNSLFNEIGEEEFLQQLNIAKSNGYSVDTITYNAICNMKKKIGIDVINGHQLQNTVAQGEHPLRISRLQDPPTVRNSGCPARGA